MPNLYLQQADGTPVATFKLYNDFTARTGQEEVTILGIIPEAATATPAPAGSYTRTTSPDLMDGGVTSALVEEEADAAYPRTDEEATLRLAAEQIAEAQAEATAAVTAKEKAEQERDEARRERDNLRAQLEADSDVNYLLREDRDAWKRKAAEQPRPLTLSGVDLAATRRAMGVLRGMGYRVAEATVGEALAAALTAPQRPEGAEELGRLIDSQFNSDEGIYADDLADFLAERGVRVVTKEQS